MIARSSCLFAPFGHDSAACFSCACPPKLLFTSYVFQPPLVSASILVSQTDVPLPNTLSHWGCFSESLLAGWDEVQAEEADTLVCLFALPGQRSGLPLGQCGCVCSTGEPNPNLSSHNLRFSTPLSRHRVAGWSPAMVLFFVSLLCLEWVPCPISAKHPDVSFPSTNRGISFLPASPHRICWGGSESQEVMEHLWEEQGVSQMWEKSNFQWVWGGWQCGLAEKSCEDFHSLMCSTSTSADTDSDSLPPRDEAKLPLLLCWRHQIELFCALPQKADLAVPALLGSPVPGPPTVLLLHLMAS